MGSTLTNANICVPSVNKTDHTVVEYYADCMAVCNVWVWNGNNTPKLGGFGKVVEMDESFFPGAPSTIEEEDWEPIGTK